MKAAGYDRVRNKISRTALLLGAAVTVSYATPSLAQTADAQSPENAQLGAAGTAVDEIVVYAQKRGAQSVQNVPIAITAFDDRKLEAVFAQDLESLSFSTPNVSLDVLGYPGLANFAIRGLGSNSSIPSIDPTVGVFIDGIYQGTTTGVVFDFFDLDGIEILRGPQGVLFGKNVAGGAILLRTKRPGRDFKVTAKAGLESGIKTTIAGTVEGPLSSTLSGKIAAYYSDGKGTIENITLGKDMGDDRTRFVRGSLNFQGDGVDAFLALEVGKQTGDGGVQQNVVAVGGPDRKFVVASDELGFSDINWKSATLEMNGDVDLGDGKITSVTGYRDTDAVQLTDADGAPTKTFHLGTKAFAEQFSQELRYAGTFGDIWDVTTGVYYFRQNLVYFEQRFLGAAISNFGGEQKTSSYGAFFNNDVKVSDTLTLTAGLRYTRETKTAKIAPQALPLTLPSSCNYTAETCVFSFSDKHVASGWTPKLGIQWEPVSDYLFYATYSKGFRSGGYNLRHTVAATPISTGDERLTSYEIGAKTQFLDRRITANLAAFRIEIDNILRDTIFFDPVTSSTIQLNRNAGDAHVQGVELELSALVTDAFSLNLSGGYNKGKYDRLILDISGDGVINERDYSLILPRLTKWTLSAGANYDIPVGDGVVSARTDFSYRSRSPYNDSNTGFLRAASILNASLTWKPSSSFSLSAYGRNLLNDATEGSGTPFGASFIRLIKPGRTFGTEARVQF